MKKTMKTLLALMAGTLAFTACSNEDVIINENSDNQSIAKGIRTFTAFTESNPATRATIDGLSVKWQENDEILVMSDNDHFDYYMLTDGANTTSGTFEAEYDGVSGNPIYAVYPKAASKEQEVTLEEAVNAATGYRGVTEAIATAVLSGSAETRQQKKWEDSGAENDPIVQAYLNGGYLYTSGYPVDGSTIKELFIPYIQWEMTNANGVVMVAKADELNNLAFKNVCSYIKVTTTTPLYQIEVCSNNGEYLTGKFDVDFSSETPVVTSVVSGTGTNYVYYVAESSGNLAPGTYYIAVLPGTLTGGLTIKYYTDISNYTEKSTSNSFTFERNKVHDAGSQPGVPATTTGTAKATIGGSEVDVNWVQLWAGGPKFAEQDVEDEMTFLDATAADASFVWGANWCTPSKADMDELLKAATSIGSTKVTCIYTQENSVWGFKFTGIETGYTTNSLFFPSQAKSSDSSFGGATYWSSTVDEDGGLAMYMLYSDDGLGLVGAWYSSSLEDEDEFLVRPVLKEN